METGVPNPAEEGSETPVRTATAGGERVSTLQDVPIAPEHHYQQAGRREVDRTNSWSGSSLKMNSARGRHNRQGGRLQGVRR